MPPLPKIDVSLPDIASHYRSGSSNIESEFANEFYKLRDKKLSLLETQAAYNNSLKAI